MRNVERSEGVPSFRDEKKRKGRKEVKRNPVVRSGRMRRSGKGGGAAKGGAVRLTEL